MANKWQMNRAGILNYWYYDEAVFEFAGGRLLLRGSNGSGKSVTMQSLITILLDGVKTANRLDSFGSRSRRIEDYLLGEKEISDIEDRTGYLYLEYKREESDQYVTTGIGLHARRGASKVDFWGFLLQNGRRIGKGGGNGLELFKWEKDPATGRKQRVPLTRKELENRIGTDGRVTTDQHEYMKMVNQHVFGFATVEQYDELMQILIQLRSPKLSRDFKPSVIYEILNASLPSLSEEDLRPLAETLNNMEQTRENIENLGKERASFERICKAYDRCNRAIFAQKQEEMTLSRHRCARARHELEQAAGKEEAAAQSREECIRRLQELTVEEDALRDEQDDLKQNEAYRAAEEKKEVADDLAKRQAEHAKRSKELSGKKQRELQKQNQTQEQQKRMDDGEEKARDKMEEMADLAEDAAFSEHRFWQDSFQLSEAKDGQWEAWQRSWQDYQKLLQDVRRLLAETVRKQEQIARLEEELGKENQWLDKYRDEHRTLLQKLDAARDAMVKSYYEWQKRWQGLLTVLPEDETEITGAMQALFREAGTEWEDVLSVLNRVHDAKRQELARAKGSIEVRQEALSQREKETRAELMELRQAKEAEPSIAPELQAARSSLRSANVPFLPLYEAVEFRREVSEEMRERMESALSDAGLLTALILKDDDAAGALRGMEEMYGSILFPAEVPLLSRTLFDYLEPVPGDSGISAERIASVISSIVVTDDIYAVPEAAGTYVNLAKGAYQIGSLSGRAPRRERALYIGRQAREAYRRQQIAEKEEELQGIAREQETASAELAVLAGQEEELAECRRDFPSEKELTELHLAEMGKQQAIRQQEQRVSEKDAQKKEEVLQLRSLRQEISEHSSGVSLPADMESYESALDAMAYYRSALSDLQMEQREYLHAADMRQHFEEELSALRSEVDELQAMLVDQEMEIQRREKRLASLNALLEELDAAAIEKRLAEIVDRLHQLPEERDAAVAGKQDAERDIREAEEAKERLGRQMKLHEQLRSGWENLLREELQRGFLFNGSAEPSKAEVQDAVNQWVKEKRPFPSALMQEVSKQCAEEQGRLTSYRISIREQTGEIPEMPELLPEDQDFFGKAWQELAEKATRSVVVIEAASGAISPYQQRDQITIQLEEQKKLLSEQDEKVYREIIMNSIGRTISDRIYSAESWVRKMNKLMRSSDTSSGLKFHLEWKPLPAEQDDELATGELVELLHADPVTLKDEDMDKIVRHFQNRINRARERADGEEEDMEAFQRSVRELLDYRQWFRFRLSYDLGSEIRQRELTDRAFFRFSGGEKAMAMYIPLFSAAYSRYLEAGPDAPYIITLDEAFAGVDEHNIRDMFKLVEQLHFNYIMNSQALWGDYDVVPSLNVYELLRPTNASFVTVVPYHWDGRLRTAMLPEDEGEENDGR